MSAANERNEKTCAELVKDKLEGRLEDILPDFDSIENVLLYFSNYESGGLNGLMDECSLDYDDAMDRFCEENKHTKEKVEAQAQLFEEFSEFVWDEDEDAILEYIREFHQERMSEMPLCIGKIDVYRIDISTGGPADFFKLEWDPDHRCWTGGTYHYQDWFDGAVEYLNHDQAEQIAEAFCIYPEG